MTRTLVVTLSISSVTAYHPLNFLPTFSLRLNPTRVKISLNSSSSLSFLNADTHPIRSSSMDSKTDSFSSSIFSSSEISSFWGTSTFITPSGTQKVLLTPVGRKCSNRSSPLTSFVSMTLTHQLFSITPVAVHHLLTSPLLPPLLLPGGVEDLGSDRPPILLTIPLSPLFRPNERPPSFNVRKVRWDDFAFYVDSHCPFA